MLNYIQRRLFQLIPIIFLIVSINFVLMHAAPGDPIRYLIGDTPAVDPSFVAGLRARYGLDQPLYMQLLKYYIQLAHGDLGYSYISHETVWNILMSRLPATLLLLGSQFVLSTILGVLIGAVSAYRQGGVLDQSVTVISLIGFSVPAFWLAQMMMLVFSLKLGLFPAQGMQSLRVPESGFGAFFDLLHHLMLPMITLMVFNLAVVARVTRASMVNTLTMEYVTYARSKGAPEKTVVWVHALRNAILPVVTITGLNIRTLIAGAVLTETVFAWPGIGRLTYDSVISRDYPVLLGILMMISFTVVIGNILTDVAYALLDPRVRFT
jgi:peptide/nickel transport system permease protein